MTWKCPFCGLTKRKIKDIKHHIKESKCNYWSKWLLGKEE